MDTTTPSPWPFAVTLSAPVNLSAVNLSLASVADYEIRGTDDNAIVEFNGVVLGIPVSDTTNADAVKADVAAWITANKK